MSANKTPNLNLHSWTGTDYVKRTEFNDNFNTVDGAIGDKSILQTTDKTTIVNAVNELFTNVSSGKDLVGTAITGVDSGVIVPTNPTFQNLADAISGISTGVSIKSIQHGTTSLTSTNNYVDVSTFDPNKAILKLAVRSTTSAEAYYFVEGRISSESRILFSRYLSGGTVEVEWTLIEYEGNIKIQRGRSYNELSVTSFTTAIEPVNLNNSYIVFSHQTNYNSDVSTNLLTASFLGNNQIEFKSLKATYNKVFVSWFVVEHI